MSVELAGEIWRLVRESIPYDDKSSLAEGLVGILIDQGYELDDIAYEFTGDAAMQNAIKWYADEDSGDGDHDEYYDDVDGDEDW